MTGLEPRTSSVWRDRSTNWATTTDFPKQNFVMRFFFKQSNLEMFQKIKNLNWQH